LRGQSAEQEIKLSNSETFEFMKVHLKQIPVQGLHLKGEENCPIQELESQGIRCAGRLDYDLDLGVAGGALWVNGSLSQPVELSCVSCLEKFVHEIRVPAFAVHVELHGPEAVDLTPSMREEILLNMPAHPHCDRDGNRVCKAKRVKTQEQEMKRESDWSALDQLNLKR
jgi:uncharacterized metal-binding protein YceD (DUF177 family)